MPRPAAHTVSGFAALAASVVAILLPPASLNRSLLARSPQGPASTQESAPAEKLSSDHLPNPVQLHEKVISGGLPEGDAAFKELADMGVKTIISVDGMTPDVETAKKFGLRYVHLPHGYNGIPDQRVKELAKAVRDLEGPIYIHCHHGKHRSPAAATVACVAAGLVPPDRAVNILQLAGTNPNYQGLYDAARSAHAIDKSTLDALMVDFKEVQEIPPMAEAMVHLSHAQERLNLIASAGWRTPTDHPDLSPAHEALLLRELFTELLRTQEVKSQPADFQGWIRDSEQAAQQLETALQKADRAGTSQQSTDEFTRLSQKISSACKACHVKYRDIPLSDVQ